MLDVRYTWRCVLAGEMHALYLIRPIHGSTPPQPSRGTRHATVETCVSASRRVQPVVYVV